MLRDKTNDTNKLFSCYYFAGVEGQGLPGVHGSQIHFFITVGLGHHQTGYSDRAPAVDLHHGEHIICKTLDSTTEFCRGYWNDKDFALFIGSIVFTYFLSILNGFYLSLYSKCMIN